VLLLQLLALDLLVHLDEGLDLVAVLYQVLFYHKGQEFHEHQVLWLELAYGRIQVLDFLLVKKHFLLDFLLLGKLEHQLRLGHAHLIFIGCLAN